jgi:hypothetical protein
MFIGGEQATMGFNKDGPFRATFGNRFTIGQVNPVDGFAGAAPERVQIGALDTDCIISAGQPFEAPVDLGAVREPPVTGSQGFYTRVYFMYDDKNPNASTNLKPYYYTNLGLRIGVHRWSVPQPDAAVPLPGAGPADGTEKPPAAVEKKRSGGEGKLTYFMGNLEMGGFEFLPYPDIHKLAR